MAKTVRVIPASPKIFRSEVTAEPRRRTRTTSRAVQTGISSACIRMKG